ncbi:spore cortex biosynthesis protein YabQ [Anaerofustis sp.]|uniref:spore cortex biosynthesis protein YabQ n=1 Tax=Anaerofustis sp. TaxID=1872517 RepID=UPI003457F140
MNSTLYSQYLILLETFYGGCILGILYHTITITVYAITKKVTLSDLCFCLVAGVFTVNLFFKTTYFDLRYYSVLSFVLGFVAYYFFISSFYKKILFFIVGSIRNFCNKIKKSMRRKRNKWSSKYNKPIGKIKTLLNNILSIPLKIKMSYNTFKIYHAKGMDNNAKRRVSFAEYKRQYRSKKEKSKKAKKKGR